MMHEPGSVEWQSSLLRSWQQALLRFAVTLHNADRLSLLVIANEIDRLGQPYEQASEFTFFRRTSMEICSAILAPNDAAKKALRQYLARVEDIRLKRALAAALDIGRSEAGEADRHPRRDKDLWSGLPSHLRA